MAEQSNIKHLVSTKLNLDTHYSLLENGDLVYLLNGDISGNEGNTGVFIQNMLGNESCFEFPEGFTLKGKVKLDNSEYALFLQSESYDEIGIINTDECTYNTLVTGTCFNFNNPVRGVYKYNNGDNDRRIYFIDGENPNRYLDIDKPYPKNYTGSKCDSCSVTEQGTVDCDALDINKSFKPPCITVEQSEFGQLLSGVYQIGVAYGMDNLILTDFYFSPAIKLFSESSNIAINVETECIDSPFDQYFVVLVSNTRENSLVCYNMGSFPVSLNNITIANTDNATIISTQQILQKRPVFDSSTHIATNGEILLLGKHGSTEVLNYQPQANNIQVSWMEIRVPKSEAHKYPSFMRDEVYAIGIRWFGKKGNDRGSFHIPGREATLDDLTEIVADNYLTNDIYEIEDCTGATKYKWQIENTASLDVFNDYDCNNCSGDVINKVGTMGYWESQDFVYPADTDMWGNLACTPIRHHRMPSHDLTHIHDDFTIESTPSGECYTIEVPDYNGETVYSYEYCPSGESYVKDADCVNILTIRVTNIEHPQTSGGFNDLDISGYQILVGDRKGNKSILHKGLVFNVQRDTSTSGTEILYPNYPFNDLHGDVFLSAAQTSDNYNGASAFAGWASPNLYYKNQFTYHSPDIHFREIKQEFGTELKVYGESIGWIEGNFTNVYKHPMTRLGRGGITTSAYTNHAAQLNSVCHYSAFQPWSTPYFSRFKIESSQYLIPVNQVLSNGRKLNNTGRESSYYVELNRDLDNPTNIDTSRVIASELGYFGNFSLPTFNYFDTVKRVDNSVLDDVNIQGVSYYTGVKINNPNQYGALEQISYRPAGCITAVYFAPDPEEVIIPYSSDTIYGGDVFISKHSLVRKMPIFTEWLDDVPIDTETDYREYRNIWYPRFWYDNLTAADDKYNLDGFTDLDPGGDILAYGKFYIFVSGVIHFWCESEFIGNYREQDFTPNGSFYPKTDYPDLVRSDKIVYDNKFLYNLTLLNNEIERVYQDTTPTASDNDFVVSYSLKNDVQSSDDKWLQFLPLNYTILPRIYGRFSGMHYTDDYSIMFAFENQILYSQLNYTLNTNEGNSLLLTQGDIFTNRLRKLSNEETGYVGCVDPESFVNTRYGTYFIDRYRKRMFRWNGQLEDVTDTMASWFKHYLSKDYPEYITGIRTVFDNYTKNIYITGGPERGKWTLSYKPERGGFISFHSFIPDYYFSDTDTFLTSNSVGIWKHNSEFNYQSYYGEQVTFDVGILINNLYRNNELQSVELFAEFMQYSSYGSPVYKENVFFDKIFAYNNNGSTGLLDVFLKDRDNPQHSFVQNSDTNSPIVSEVTNVGDSLFRFNKFENIRKNHNTQPLITWDSTGVYYTPASIDYTISPVNRESIKGKWIKLHLISDSNTDNKIIVQLLAPQEDEIKR